MQKGVSYNIPLIGVAEELLVGSVVGFVHSVQVR